MIVRVSQGHGCIDHKLKCNLIEPAQVVSGNRAGNQKGCRISKTMRRFVLTEIMGRRIHGQCAQCLQPPAATILYPGTVRSGGQNLGLLQSLYGYRYAFVTVPQGQPSHGLGHQPNTPKFKASGIITV
uniref:OSJNBa0044M19.7 protein n=1 Tax=Oryza sativa subsp. japonica TaxID=39947 RepID=Q7XLP9_ORYSJ|nr:OSJNBa0044M19.7 [Oryza sativa Japonica Group]